MGKETLFIFKKTFDDGSENPYWEDNPDYVIHYLRTKEMYLNALVKYNSPCITEELLEEECGIELLDHNNKFISESGKIITLGTWDFDNKNLVEFYNGNRDYLILNVRFMEE